MMIYVRPRPREGRTAGRLQAEVVEHYGRGMRSHSDDTTVREVRDSTKTAVEYGIQFLLEEREHDKNRSLIDRLLGPEHR